MGLRYADCGLFSDSMSAARQFQIASTPCSSNSDRLTAETVPLICRHIESATADPLVQRLAREIKANWALGPSQVTGTAWAVFWWLKHNVRFKTDEAAILQLLNDLADHMDLLINPSVLIRMQPPQGDCDDFTMLGCALLACNGIPFDIVTLKCDPKRPDEWSHIYFRAELPDGRRMALDPTPPGQYPGWEVPAEDVFERQVWNSWGQPVNAPESMRDLGMHAYVALRRRGVGQGVDVPDTTAGQGIGIPGVDIPVSSPGFNWNQFINTLASVGTRLGSQALLPQGSSLLPSGAVISPYGAASGLLAPGSIGGVSLGSVLIYGGIGLAVLLAISAMGKR